MAYVGRRSRREQPDVAPGDLPCQCWRLDLPHGHTISECRSTPKPGRG